MPMTAKQILAASFPVVKEGAKHVIIKEDQSLTPSFRRVPGNKKLNGAPKLVATVYSTATSDGSAKKGAPRKYKAVVAGMDNEMKLSEGPVMVACTCDYFTFTCEVALAKKGASKISQSNGEKPEVRNPKMVPTPCKHLHRLLTLIVKRRM
jgi:hypothetical protein